MCEAPSWRLAEFRSEESVMKVKDVMTQEVRTCRLDSDLSAVARSMWLRDCGVIPVVDDGEVLGVITDRDICIAAGSKNREPYRITVSEVMARRLYSCSPDDNIREALEIMRKKQVRRLPVIDAKGKLQGILSLNDVAIKAREINNPAELSAEDIEQTLEAICRRRYGPQAESQSKAAA
jgi:CBS domain-containing protein